MKKIALMAAAVIATAVHAEEVSSNFEKFSVYGNFHHITSSTKFSINGSSFDGVGTSATGLSIGADKGFEFGKSGAVLVGGEIMLSNPKYLDITTRTSHLNTKQKEGYSLYVAPGVKVSDNTLVYFKVGLEHLKLEGSGGGESSFSGTSYGVGTRINFDPKFFMTVEFKQTSFSEKDNSTPKATIGTVGLGYYF
jgi:opacity protein-like surface antigen